MQNNRDLCIVKPLDKLIKFMFLSLPLAVMEVLVLFQIFSAPAPEISSTASWHFSGKTELPPLAPDPEENSDSGGTLRGLLPGTLPPALVSRRSGERVNCRLLRDSNTDIVRPAVLRIPETFLKQRAAVPALEFHTFLQHSLPPRAGPSAV